MLQPLDLLQHTKIDYLPHATSVGGVFTAKLPVDGSSLRQLRHELANNKQDEPGDYVVRVRKDRRRNVIDVCRVAVVHTLVAHIVYDGRAFLVLRRAKNCVRRNVTPPPPSRTVYDWVVGLRASMSLGAIAWQFTIIMISVIAIDEHIVW